MPICRTLTRMMLWRNWHDRLRVVGSCELHKLTAWDEDAATDTT